MDGLFQLFWAHAEELIDLYTDCSGLFSNEISNSRSWVQESPWKCICLSGNVSWILCMEPRRGVLPSERQEQSTALLFWGLLGRLEHREGKVRNCPKASRHTPAGSAYGWCALTGILYYLSRHWRMDSFFIPPSCPLQHALLTIWSTSPSRLRETRRNLGCHLGKTKCLDKVCLFIFVDAGSVSVNLVLKKMERRCAIGWGERYQAKDNSLNEAWELAKKRVKFIVFLQLYSTFSAPRIDLIEMW